MEVIHDKNDTSVNQINREWLNKGQRVANLCKKKEVVVQAGGHVGIFPLGLSKHFSTVITFEAVISNYNYLELNTANIDNIICLNKALGDKLGKAKVNRLVDHNLGATGIGYEEDGDIIVEPLDLYPLDNLDLLWLDLEGFEMKALIGARRHILKHRPIVVLENNGLIKEFPGTLDGSPEFRTWFTNTFNYTYHSRIMRDDIFLPL